MRPEVVLPGRHNAVVEIATSSTRLIQTLAAPRKILISNPSHAKPVSLVKSMHNEDNAAIWVTSIVHNIVDNAMLAIPTNFENDMEFHLNTFLRAIRQHVVPQSPSSYSAEWNEQCNHDEQDHNDDFSEIDEGKIVLGRVIEPDNVQRRLSPILLTVDAFRAAFETGDFSRVDEFMSSYEVSTPPDDRFKFLHDSRLINRTKTLQVIQQLEDERRNKAFDSPTVQTSLMTVEESVDGPSTGIHALLREINEDLNMDHKVGSRSQSYAPTPLASMLMPTIQAPEPIHDDERDGLDNMFEKAKPDSSAISLISGPLDLLEGSHVPRRDVTLSLASSNSLIRTFRVIKHGRRGQPKEKNLVVDTDIGVITWGTSSILIKDVRQIRCGRQTTVLNKRSLKNINEGMFASIVTGSRTVDLEVSSRSERNFIVSQIQGLISSYLRKDSNKSASWRCQNSGFTAETANLSLTTTDSSKSQLQVVVAKIKRLTMCTFRRESSLSLSLTHHF